MNLYKYLYTVFNLRKNIELIGAYNSKTPYKNGIKRVYHHHLMKTGGTSINKMFLALSESGQGDNLYNELTDKPDMRMIKNDWVYTAWNPLFKQTKYWHYGWSHKPYSNIKLPPETFTITSFRHPYKRIFSRYKQLVAYKENGEFSKAHSSYFAHLGNSFKEYLNKISRKEVCHQLYMFSINLDVNEAIERLNQIDFIIHLNSFNEDIDKLNEILGTNLVPLHARKRKSNEDIDINESFKSIKKVIEPELEFYKRAISYKCNGV